MVDLQLSEANIETNEEGLSDISEEGLSDTYLCQQRYIKYTCSS